MIRSLWRTTFLKNRNRAAQKGSALVHLFLFFLSACSHYILPVTHLETSETRGQVAGEGPGKMGRIGRIELPGLWMGNDLIARPGWSYPDAESSDSPHLQLQEALTSALGFTMGLSDSVDVGIRLMPMAPLTFRLKVQLSGPSEINAAPGDFSTALTISPGAMLGNQQGQSTSYFWGDLALIAGYRWTRRSLILFSPFYSFASLSGIPLTATVERLTPANKTGSASASQYGAALGFQYTIDSLFFRSEIATAAGSFEEPKISGWYGGALMGFNF